MQLIRGFNLFACIFGIWVCSACMDIRAVDQETDRVRETSAPVTVPTAVSDGGWNSYRVFVPSDLTIGSVRKSRWDLATKNFIAPMYLPVLPGSSFQDLDVQPGGVYFYEWGSLKSGVFSPTGHARVAIPLDLEVRGEVLEGSEIATKLFTTPRFGHLIFREGSVLTTSGRDLEWDVDTILFEQAIVRSFVAGSTATLGEPGRSGGRLVLRAGEIKGDLRFEGRGENGGEGLPGADPGPELRGEGGQDGILPEGSERGIGFSSVFTCRTQGGNGAMGFPGHPGNIGGAGGDGGDSGRIVVISKNHQGLNLDSTFDVGHGGIGGVGGEGGEGGPGGRGGRRMSVFGNPLSTEGCNPIFDGAKGPRGPRGPQGQRGSSGQFRN